MDVISQMTFLNAFSSILIKISLKYVSKGPIDIKSTLVQVKAWHQTGNKPLSEPMMTQFNDTSMPHPASMR